MTVILTSTTDSPAQVNEAASLGGAAVIQPAEPAADAEQKVPRGEGGQITVSDKGRVASTTDNKAAVEAVQADLDEGKQERSDEYVGKTRKRLLSRLSRLHSEVEERDQTIAELRRKYEPSAEQNGEARPESDAGAEQPAGKPTRAQLEEQYRQEMAAIEAQLTWPYKLEVAKARYSDFDAAVKSAEGHELPIWALRGLGHFRNGADVLYFLAKNTGYVDEIRALDAAGQGTQAFGLLNSISSGLAIGSLHNQPAARQPANRSAAPPPVEPLRGTSARGSRSLADPDLPFAEFKKMRDAQERGRR
jgi:hypothetical protein